MVPLIRKKIKSKKYIIAILLGLSVILSASNVEQQQSFLDTCAQVLDDKRNQISDYQTRANRSAVVCAWLPHKGKIAGEYDFLGRLQKLYFERNSEVQSQISRVVSLVPGSSIYIGRQRFEYEQEKGVGAGYDHCYSLGIVPGTFVRKDD